MKKIICIILAVILTFGFTENMVTYAGVSKTTTIIETEKYSGYDTTAPMINSGRILTPNIKKPGVAKIELDLIEEETGVTKIYVSLMMKNSKTLEVVLPYNTTPVQTLFTGKAIVEVPIKSTVAEGDYFIQRIYVEDAAGNKSEYYCPYTDYEGANGESYLIGSWDNSIHCPVTDYKYLKIENEFDVAFDTSLSNPNLPEKLASMEEGKVGFIRVDSTSSYICKKAIFDSIKGYNKKIILSLDNIQWIFDGRDIINETKDININIQFSRISGNVYSSVNDLLKMSFYPNGVLPGKARIRVKSDYTSSLLHYSGNLYLYYINGENLALEKSAEEIVLYLDGMDQWCEFDLTHNSDFLLSDEKLVQPKPQTVKGTKYTTKGIVYKVTDISSKKRAVSVDKITDKKKSSITIPDKITIGKHDYKVTSIGKNAFKDCKRLVKVTLGKNIVKIESKAFYGNKKLKQINIKSSGIKSIGSKAFDKIAKKSVIKVPSKMVKRYYKMLKKSGIDKSITVKKIS